MEFYEEALSLVYDLTSKKISADLWKVLEMIYQVRSYKVYKFLVGADGLIFSGFRKRRL